MPSGQEFPGGRPRKTTWPACRCSTHCRFRTATPERGSRTRCGTAEIYAFRRTPRGDPRMPARIACVSRSSRLVVQGRFHGLEQEVMAERDVLDPRIDEES